MSTMREALTTAMRGPSDEDLGRQLQKVGLAIADEDSMSRAVHDVYCGLMADHTHPSEKDRAQARQLLAALQGNTPS
jgi:hypothetical protein